MNEGKLLQGYEDDEDRSGREREACGPRFHGERGRPSGCTATCPREGEHPLHNPSSPNQSIVVIGNTQFVTRTVSSAPNVFISLKYLFERIKSLECQRFFLT